VSSVLLRRAPFLAVAQSVSTLPPDDLSEVRVLFDPANPEHAAFLKSAAERGSATFDEINAILPCEQVTSEQIETLMGFLSDRGIAVVDNDA
jgi:hypothetical protein